jgi:hypothetical protein
VPGVAGVGFAVAEVVRTSTQASAHCAHCLLGEDVDGVIDLKRACSGTACSANPRSELSGLQLVDAVAYTVRRAVREPDDDSGQEAYDAIRAKAQR